MAACHKGSVEVRASTHNRWVAPVVRLMMIHVSVLMGGPWSVLLVFFSGVLGVVETVVTPLPARSDSGAR